MDDIKTTAPLEQLWGKALVLSLKWVRQGSFQALVDLEIPAIGLTFFECKWFSKDGKEWVKLPQRNYLDGIGQRQYVELHKLRGPVYRAFQPAAVEAIHDYIDEAKRETAANEPF